MADDLHGRRSGCFGDGSASAGGGWNLHDAAEGDFGSDIRSVERHLHGGADGGWLRHGNGVDLERGWRRRNTGNGHRESDMERRGAGIMHNDGGYVDWLHCGDLHDFWHGRRWRSRLVRGVCRLVNGRNARTIIWFVEPKWGIRGGRVGGRDGRCGGVA